LRGCDPSAHDGAGRNTQARAIIVAAIYPAAIADGAAANCGAAIRDGTTTTDGAAIRDGTATTYSAAANCGATASPDARRPRFTRNTHDAESGNGRNGNDSTI
jgi:hypothetical protein